MRKLMDAEQTEISGGKVKSQANKPENNMP